MNGNDSGFLPGIDEAGGSLVVDEGGLRDAIEEADRALEQLLEVQSRLELEILNHADACRDKDVLESKLAKANKENELLLMRLQQVQEDDREKLRNTQQDLEYYFLECQDLKVQLARHAEKLDWLRGQRELLMRMVGKQSQSLGEMMALGARAAIPMVKFQGLSWWRKITLR